MDVGNVAAEIGEALGCAVLGVDRMHGGCVGEVHRADCEGLGRVVAKRGPSGSGLDIEGRMLEYLSARTPLPVPRVLHSSDRLLVMEHMEHSGGLDATGEREMADLLAGLHAITPSRDETRDRVEGEPAYGLGFGTLIGGIEQPNGWWESWARFYGERRVLWMTERATGAGRLDASVARRVEQLADRMEEVLGDPGDCGLIHGDVWGGNVLARRGRVVGLIDPAIYYADPEVELAFIALFGTLGKPFYEQYGSLREIRAGFWETRCDVYQLYPLLVHTALFGRGYASAVERALDRLGF